MADKDVRQAWRGFVIRRPLDSAGGIGKYSYGLYLYHMLVLYLVEIWRPAQVAPDGTIVDPSHFQPFFGSIVYDAPIRLLLVSFITVLLAWMSFHLLERPILGLKRFFDDNQKSPVPVLPRPAGGAVAHGEGGC